MGGWPRLDYARWRGTGGSLHMWTQIVGKFRLAQSPWVNHSWHATLYVNARGLTTGLVPGSHVSHEVQFDFLDHQLTVSNTLGVSETMVLETMPVAAFHARFLEMLESTGAATEFHGAPNEIPDPVPFAQQTWPGDYDPEAARDFWHAMVNVDRVFTHFRSGFLGKVSPVHFFWGSFDAAVTRFSGRRAPLHPGGLPALPDEISREAYSHEVSSAGFWPGGDGFEEAAFYAYAYPTPDGFEEAPIRPREAFWSPEGGEFLLPYDAVRRADDPDAALMAFLQSTYDAAADLADWDRAALDCPVGQPRVVREL
ncbi:DUF5996 family protein [Oricola cellulosilytica]|uniref:Ava_C0101 and related proteins n=1 Tax=Oricola cellulosilytica TaxID=1429082 RepID=A0A4R0P5V3_9HYPH|nr:DUF5996 family protein [Oricola cellulosilytica]TCD11281.1 hypothetical protein E0D97_17295 [Oricola cellulosilytica]